MDEYATLLVTGVHNLSLSNLWFSWVSQLTPEVEAQFENNLRTRDATWNGKGSQWFLCDVWFTGT